MEPVRGVAFCYMQIGQMMPGPCHYWLDPVRGRRELCPLAPGVLVLPDRLMLVNRGASAPFLIAPLCASCAETKGFLLQEVMRVCWAGDQRSLEGWRDCAAAGGFPCSVPTEALLNEGVGGCSGGGIVLSFPPCVFLEQHRPDVVALCSLPTAFDSDNCRIGHAWIIPIRN